MELLNPMPKADYQAYSVVYAGTAGNVSTWLLKPQGVVWPDQTQNDFETENLENLVQKDARFILLE